MLLFIIFICIILAVALWWLARGGNPQLAKKLGLSGVVSWYQKREKSEISVIIFISIISFVILLLLAGGVAGDRKMTNVAEFGLLLFDSLLAMVIFILGVGGVFGYQAIKKWTEDEAKKTADDYLKGSEFKGQIGKAVGEELQKVARDEAKKVAEEHIKSDDFQAKLQKLVSEQAESTEEKTGPSSTQETRRANKVDREKP